MQGSWRDKILNLLVDSANIMTVKSKGTGHQTLCKEDYHGTKFWHLQMD